MMSPKGKITVVLADDTLIAREGWKRLLETSEEIKVIGEIVVAQEASNIVTELKPHVVLMDLKWYGDESAGWTAIKEIKATSPEVKIIAVTAYENLIKSARLAGADAAMMKTFTRNEMIEMIGVISEKESQPVIHDQNVLQPNKLASREVEVLQLIVKGMRDKEIASLLGISHPTAKNHVKNILEKLGAKNRTQAVSLAKELGLIE